MIAQIDNIKPLSCNGSGGCHNTPRNKQKLQEIAEQILDQAGLAGKLYPQERDFVSTASRIILQLLENYLAPTEGQAPSLETVRGLVL